MPSVILATAGYDHTIRFWEAPSGMSYRTIQYPESQVNKLEITPDKEFIAAAGNPHVRLYEVNHQAHSPKVNFDGHTGNVTALGFQKDARWMYTCSEDKTLKIWDLRAKGYQREYKCNAPVNSVLLHPNQVEIVSGDQDGVVRVWDLTANKCALVLEPEKGVPVRSLSVGIDGSMLVSSNNSGRCHIWHAATTEHTLVQVAGPRVLDAHPGCFVLKALLSPDVRLLATASSDSTIKLWNVENWKLESTLEGHERWVWDCVFSADSAYLVTASSDSTARLWDLSRSETIRHYTGHSKAIVTVALNDAPPSAS